MTPFKQMAKKQKLANLPLYYWFMLLTLFDRIGSLLQPQYTIIEQVDKHELIPSFVGLAMTILGALYEVGLEITGYCCEITPTAFTWLINFIIYQVRGPAYKR